MAYWLVRRSAFGSAVAGQRTWTATRSALAILSVCCLFASSYAAVYGESCKESSVCHKIYNSGYACIDEKCRRPPFGTSLSDVLGYIAVTLMVALSNAGGMGAGSIIIPAYIFFYDFVATDAIPLSKITIFAGACMNIILVWNQRHPHNKDGFLINYGLAASVAPFMLAGTQVGVLFAKLLPPVMIWFSLISYLSYTTYKMYKRAANPSPKPAQTMKDLDSSQITVTVTDEAMAKAEISNRAGNSSPALSAASLGFAALGNTEQGISEKDLASRIEISGSNLPARKGSPSTRQLLKENLSSFVLMALALGSIFATSVLRGGKGAASIIGLPACSAPSFALLIICQIICVSIGYLSYKINSVAESRHRGKITEIPQDKQKKIIFISFFTGLASGSIGVGGGSILNPYMLELGVDPITAAALSGFCILFSSSSTTAQFLIAGAIKIDHGIILMCLSAVGAVLGNSVIKKFIIAQGKSHHIVWIVFIILALSMLVLPVQMWFELQNFQTFFSFGSIC